MMTNKIYRIYRGTDSFDCGCDCLNATEIFEGWAYNMDNADVIFETKNKEKALAELSKYNCDAYVSKTNTGFEWSVDIVELEEEILDEEGDCEKNEIIARAEFTRKNYSYRQ